jgi:hypothetical protein
LLKTSDSPVEWRKVEIVGHLGAGKWPRICINCGSQPTRPFRIERLFTWASDEGDESWEVELMDVPLCPACADKHRRELRTAPFLDRIRRALTFENVLSALFPSLAFLFFTYKLLVYLFQAKWTTAVGMAIPVVLFGGIAGILLSQILSRSRRFGVPPDTSVSGFFTFSRDRKKLFEPSRRRYQFRNAQFAEAFLEANRLIVWDPRSEKAVNAAFYRRILQIAGVFAAGLFILWTIYDEW